MSEETLEELIIKAGDDALFVGKANEDRVNQIEKMLGISLPESYKWFLREFGHGGISGVEILGNGLGDVPSCVEYTLDWRRYGLPDSFVVIEDAGTDWIYCIDTSQKEKLEAPIVDWEQNRGVGKEYYETFMNFFKARLKEYLHKS